jgi:hypothetical protein
LILKKEKDRIKKNLIFSCAIAILASLGSPFSKVIVFIVSHLSHVAPKSAIFQKAWGVRQFGSPHFLHVYTTIE